MCWLRWGFHWIQIRKCRWQAGRNCHDDPSNQCLRWHLGHAVAVRCCIRCWESFANHNSGLLWSHPPVIQRYQSPLGCLEQRAVQHRGTQDQDPVHRSQRMSKRCWNCRGWMTMWMSWVSKKWCSALGQWNHSFAFVATMSLPWGRCFVRGWEWIR